jgi:hypothetical protein
MVSGNIYVVILMVSYICFIFLFFYFSFPSGGEEVYLHVASSITFSLITGLDYLFFIVFVCVCFVYVIWFCEIWFLLYRICITWNNKPSTQK